MSYRLLGIGVILCGVGSGCGGEAVKANADLGKRTQRLAGSTSFQQGVNGYTGTIDVSINNQNGGNGLEAYKTATLLPIYKVSGTGAYETSPLIRFTNLSVPAGAHVTRATLTLAIENWWTPHQLDGYYLNTSWDGTSSALGWLNRSSTAQWAVPGARGSGSDILSGKSFSFVFGSGETGDPVIKTVDLDPAVVQAWVDNANTDFGVALVNPVTDRTQRIHASEDTTVANHPLLTIEYDASDGGASGCSEAVGGGAWVNDAFSAQTGAFTAELDMKTSVAPTDAVVGLSSGAAGAYTDLATIVRFSSAGNIDVRNGSVYASAATLNYAANASYHVKMDVNVPTHKYSVWVTAPGSSAVQLASNYDFRTEQNAVTSLSNAAKFVDTTSGALDACNFTATNSAPPPPPPPPPPPGNHPRIWLDSGMLNRLSLKVSSGSSEWTTLRSKCQTFAAQTVSYPMDQSSQINDAGTGEGYFGPLFSTALCYRMSGVSGSGVDGSAMKAKAREILLKMSDPGHQPNYKADDVYSPRFYGVALAVAYDWLYADLSAAERAQVYKSLDTWIQTYELYSKTSNHPLTNYFAGYYALLAYAGIAAEGDSYSGTNYQTYPPGSPNAGQPVPMRTPAQHWSKFLNQVHGGPANSVGSHLGVAQYTSAFLDGGGWPEGWQYGPLASLNMLLPTLAAKTGKGIDLVAGSPAYPYALDAGKFMMHFMWPDRKHMDDRDSYKEPNSMLASPEAVTAAASMLETWNDPDAAKFRKIAQEVTTNLPSGNTQQAWKDGDWPRFLFSVPSTGSDYTTLPRSYRASGLSAVSMRSDWSTNAVFGSFRAATYVNGSGTQEQFPDSGSLAIVRGGAPYLVNATGYYQLPRGTLQAAPWDDIYAEVYQVSGQGGKNEIFNVFYNGSGGQGFVPPDGTPAPTTGVKAFEDRGNNSGDYVFVRAQSLENMYVSTAGVSKWDRDVVYIRPNLFVVYDRTEVAAASSTQKMHWHFAMGSAALSEPAAPMAALSASGVYRVQTSNSIDGLLGVMTSVLPNTTTAPAIQLSDLIPNGVTSCCTNTSTGCGPAEPANCPKSTDTFSGTNVSRVVVRPSNTNTAQKWLAVFDTATDRNADGSINTSDASSAWRIATPTNANGVFIKTPTNAENYAVLFGVGRAGDPITGALSFTIPSALTRTEILVLDLASGTYNVSATAVSGGYTVSITSGGSYSLSSSGHVLRAYVNANGTVTP